jgi:AraC family transcriptional regulator
LSLELKSLELDGEDLTREILASDNKVHETFLRSQPDVEAFQKLTLPDYPYTTHRGATWTREGNSLKELEALQKIVPFAPLATSYGMGWKGLQAVRYRKNHLSELSWTGTLGTHVLALTIRPPQKMQLRYGEVKRDGPPPAGWIRVVPAGSCVRVRWEGSLDLLLIYLEPSLVARVAAESFESDPTRTVVPPLDGLNMPEVRSAMLAVDAELRAGGRGGPQLAESLATILCVHLIRHITASRQRTPSPDGVLPRCKLHSVIEYIMENLAGSPTLEQMAAVAHLSPYHFARQFRAATGLAPYQYVIVRRVERAQELLREEDDLGLGEVAFRAGFSDQSHFSSHFKRIVGVTPRQFRMSARIA